MSKFQEMNEKIAEGVTEGYQKIEGGVVEGYRMIEGGVVDGYKKIETGVVDGFKKIEDKFSDTFLKEDGSLKTGTVGEKVVEGFNKIADKFVDTFLAKDGETTGEARERIAEQQKTREEARKTDLQQRAEAQRAMIEASLEASRNAGKRN